MSVLVTGGCGYLGSHTCLALLEAGYEVVAVDNLCNSSRESLKRVSELTGQPFKLYECDVRNGMQLMQVVEQNNVEAVIHFAALKSVSESFEKPLEYYENGKAGELMHPETKELLEKLLHMLADEGEETTYQYIRREVLKKRR